jgi:glycosyltransferase involved in cell wall biosynthesis
MSRGVPEVSVVIPSYDGSARLRRLLSQLARQNLPKDAFEVVVVDDGSPRELADQLDPADYPFDLRVVRQENAGAAAARHRGAMNARGGTLVFVDDDMEVPEEFLASHAAYHAGDDRCVVLGRMHGSRGAQGLMARWYQFHLDKKAALFAARRLPIRGTFMFGGNVSMRRADYLASGGFEAKLRRGHDVELGLRLEKMGLRFEFSERAWSRHSPEEHELQWWRDRAMLYGRVDWTISKMHPDAGHASPWRWWREMNPLIRPFIQLALRAPGMAKRVASAVLGIAHALDAARLDGVALKAITVAYTVDYFRGVRAEIGSLDA